MSREGLFNKKIKEGLFDQPFSKSAKEKEIQKALKNKEDPKGVMPEAPKIGKVYTWGPSRDIRTLKEFCKVVRHPATEDDPTMEEEQGAGCVFGVAKHPEKNVLVVFSYGLMYSKEYDKQPIVMIETSLPAEGKDANGEKCISEDARNILKYMQKFMGKRSKEFRDWALYTFESSDYLPWGRFIITFNDKGFDAIGDLEYYMTVNKEKPTFMDGVYKGVWGDVRLPIVNKGSWDHDDIDWNTDLHGNGNCPNFFKVRENDFPEIFGKKENKMRANKNLNEGLISAKAQRLLNKILSGSFINVYGDQDISLLAEDLFYSWKTFLPHDFHDDVDYFGQKELMLDRAPADGKVDGRYDPLKDVFANYLENNGVLKKVDKDFQRAEKLGGYAGDPTISPKRFLKRIIDEMYTFAEKEYKKVHGNGQVLPKDDKSKALRAKYGYNESKLLKDQKIKIAEARLRIAEAELKALKEGTDYHLESPNLGYSKHQTEEPKDYESEANDLYNEFWANDGVDPVKEYASVTVENDILGDSKALEKVLTYKGEKLDDYLKEKIEWSVRESIESVYGHDDFARDSLMSDYYELFEDKMLAEVKKLLRKEGVLTESRKTKERNLKEDIDFYSGETDPAIAELRKLLKSYAPGAYEDPATYIESEEPDFFGGDEGPEVQCYCFHLGPSNSVVVGDLFRALRRFEEQHPGTAVEYRQNESYLGNYAYDVCLMNASEWYQN